MKYSNAVTAITLGLALGTGSLPIMAQQVQSLDLDSVPPDMVESDADGTSQEFGTVQPIDLGDSAPRGDQSASGGIETNSGTYGTPANLGTAVRAARQARELGKHTRKPPRSNTGPSERAVFERQPVQVALPVDSERLITLPAPAALHVPTDMAQVARLEVIDRTIYATALKPFTPIRIVAELIDSGQQIPMDLEAGKHTATATNELEVFVVAPGEPGAEIGDAQIAEAGTESGNARSTTPDMPAADMVELTRYAAQQLYAPPRLARPMPGIQQVDLAQEPVEGLIRGIKVETTPVGQWRSGGLYVTAVRVTNRSSLPVELPLEDVRGNWIAATAQHGRLGPAGSDTDTTAIYLVCERAFASCS